METQQWRVFENSYNMHCAVEIDTLIVTAAYAYELGLIMVH